MGTVNTVVVNDGPAEALDAAERCIRRLAAQLNANVTNSEIGAVNAAAGLQPVAVSRGTFELIRLARSYSLPPHEGFDCTLGPLVAAWHIGFADARRPSRQEITRALALRGAEHVLLDEAAGTVLLARPDMALDLGGIAKGWIADAAAAAMRAAGARAAVLDLGGNVVTIGTPGTHADAGWHVGVQTPFASRGEPLGVLVSRDESVVTSGVYERFADLAGQRYHHLLDPRTGYPFEGDLAAATVVAARSVDADAWASIVFAAGLRRGAALVARTPGVAAILVTRSQTVWCSPALRDRFRLLDPKRATEVEQP